MEPRLYIVMRRDLWDMNPGKGMAQAAHAQSHFDAYQSSLVNSGRDDFWQAMSAWRDDREFGVTLVLHEPLSVMNQIHERVVHTGMTVDPTYPYRNHYGEMFVRSEVTCMWAFVYTEEEEYMRQWRLHQ
jgi:peptidyl-tRNA hydrolase